MAQIDAVSLERELIRGMRPNARQFVSPNWRRFVPSGSDLASVYERYESKYRPDQARVPAGSPEGGQWTDEGGRTEVISLSPNEGDKPASGSGRNDPRILSDATPSNYYRPGAQVAARISAARAEECEFMHRQDLFICRVTQSPACYTQAYLRYSNCQQGRPIPPLNF